MQIAMQQFLGQNHSWAHVSHGLARAFVQLGHTVWLKSTDAYDYFPVDLKPYIRDDLEELVPDIALSYTFPNNFPRYLSPRAKYRFGIWNYEFDHLPVGVARNAIAIDQFLPSSKFFYDICIANGIPANKMTVVQHGVDWDRFNLAQPMQLKTDRKYKFLMNFGQCHIRKNIPGTIEAFCRAFKKQDDVCLVIKAVDKKPEKPFEINFSQVLNTIKQRYPQHAQIIILTQFVPQIECLYKACDCLFMLPHCEAFFLPALEMLASGGLVITSRYGGQLDFLNDQNSILVGGKMVRAPIQAQYWQPDIKSAMFQPSIDDAVAALQTAHRDMKQLKKEKLSSLHPIRDHFNWTAAAQKIIDLAH